MEFSGIYFWLIVVTVGRQAGVGLVVFLVLQLNKFNLTYFAESDTMTTAEASCLTC